MIQLVSDSVREAMSNMINKCGFPPEGLGAAFKDVCIDSVEIALSRVQYIHRPVKYINKKWCCVTCYDENGKPQLWPCITAKQIYPREELRKYDT